MNFRSFGYSIFLQIQTFCTYIMYTISSWIFAVLAIHNFLLNFRSSAYSIFFANPDIPYIYNVHNFQLNFHSSSYTIFLQIQTFRTCIMYTIYCWIFAVLDIQIFYKTRHSVHITYAISHPIYAVMDIQFLCKSKHSVHK